MAAEFTIRTYLRPGDLGAVVGMHGKIYASEYGFDPTFEAYVAEPLGKFAKSPSSPRERIWIAEQADRIVGCIAIVAALDESSAQLRWFLVDPSARGLGLGRRLIEQAVAFSRACGYARIILWTVDGLTNAAHLYRAVGFRLTDEKASRNWGVNVIEQKYELRVG